MEFLRHDKPLHPTRVQPHMKHVPKYLLPRMGAATVAAEGSIGGGDTATFVPFKKPQTRGRGRGRGRGGRGPGGGGRPKKKSDPLKKFGK